LAEIVVRKDKVELAIRNGLVIQRLKDCLVAEEKEFKARVSDYSKTHSLNFDGIVDVRKKLENFNHESKEMAEVLAIYPELRFTYLHDRLERKLRHAEGETNSVTNTELLVLDRLLSDDVSSFFEKYSQREYFIKDDINETADLFTSEDMQRASKQRARGVLVSRLGNPFIYYQ